DLVCFRLGLLDQAGELICETETCLEVPKCDCLQVDHRLDRFSEVECLEDGTINFQYTFQLTNLSSQNQFHTFLSSFGPETVTPDYIDLLPLNGNAPLLPGDSVVLSTYISGANPESTLNLLVAMHDEDFSDCCSRVVAVTTPACPNDILKGDVNCDGVVDLLDVQPFVALLFNASYDVKADINCDGVVDLLDIQPFIAILLGG
ncbi:MAG: hypothetical protein AAGA30_21635, partial [Planctomycetota bacterium]